MHAEALSRSSGALYLVIIAAGTTAEFAIRQTVLHPGDAAATAAAIRGAEGAFRLGFVLDAVMICADVALAALLFLLLRPVAPVLALLAMLFRLMQAALLGSGLLLHHAALTLALADDPATLMLLNLQAAGYDAGLLFFAVNTLLMSVILFRAGVSLWLPGLLAAAGLVYLGGSLVRFLAPNHLAAVQPAYLVPLVAETAFALWLLAAVPARARPAAA